MSFFNRSESNSTGYIVADSPLTEREFKERIRRGLINRKTKVRHENDKTWIRAGDVPELHRYFDEEQTQSIENSMQSFLHSIRALTEQVEELVSSLSGERVEIPEQLYETLNDYLERGTDEVALTIGKVNNKPAFIVLLISESQKPSIVAEIEIDSSCWRQKSIQQWPETGSPRAKVWNVSR
ncbi:MAG: DUF4339 domain-containing protein [Symploca sp. SIO1B1]|nr:DUF4339 domain-containing protein [Symploca sp. SIO1B1]